MKAVSKSRVDGEDGLVIQLDRGRVKYALGSMRTNVEIEHGIGEVSLYRQSIQKWFPPHEACVMDEVMRSKIVSDVCQAMNLLGVGCRVA
jgi:hypothetical protein